MRLDLLECLKMPLSYGTCECRLILGDSRYTDDIVALRNDPAVNGFIHNAPLTGENHNHWVDGQLERRDTLNFVILVRDGFAGTASLYNIEPGKGCEYGRLVMPDTPTRAYALAVEFLCLSFAFEVLGLQQVYCRTDVENSGVVNFHLANGWKMDTRYDERIQIGERMTDHAGLSIDLADWPAAFAKVKRLLSRLHGIKTRAAN